MFTTQCATSPTHTSHTHTSHSHLLTLTHAVAKNGANFHRARRSHARGGSGASPSARLVLLDLLFDENLRVTPGDIGPRSHRNTAAYHGMDTREERRVCFISNSPRLDLSIIASSHSQCHRTQLAHTHTGPRWRYRPVPRRRYIAPASRAPTAHAVSTTVELPLGEGRTGQRCG